METLEQYLNSNGNGFYDTEKIRRDAGMDAMSAMFSDFFSSANDEPGTQRAKLAEPYQSLLEEATRRNDELLAERAASREQEAKTILADGEPTELTTWRRLQKLGCAIVDTHDDGRGNYYWTANLNQAGHELHRPGYVADGRYDDFAERDMLGVARDAEVD